MLRQVQFFVLLAFLLFKSLFALASPQTELYLSYEQRVAITYALLAQGEETTVKEKVLDRAQNYFQQLANLPVQTKSVNNFAEFLNDFRGQWPDTHKVSLDMDLIEKSGVRPLRIYEAKSPRIQKQIDQYLEWQQAQLEAIMKQQKGFDDNSLQGLQEKIGALLMNPQAQKLVGQMILENSEEFLGERMREMNSVGEKIANSGFAQQQDATMRIFMQTMFSEYFSRLGADSKKLIVSSFLGGDLLASDLRKFEIMVQNSGPQLQKLLQVVARQADLGADMLTVFRNLENSVRPVAWSQVSELLHKEQSNFKFLYFEQKPLGVGTMAQVHRAKILQNGERKDVVVRFIKPGINERVQEDHRILSSVAKILDANPEFRKTGAPKLEPIIEDITSTVTAELNQEETIQRQRLAKTRYDKTVLLKTPEYKNYLEFHVPTIYAGKGPSEFMVQELVIGRKLDKEVAQYSEMAPGLKKAIVEEISKLWAHEVLFGKGFYHSDLHQGNFMIQVSDAKIRLNILDYGMGGEIPPQMQRLVLLLAAGIDLKREDIIARAFWKLSQQDKNSIREVQFRSLVKERLLRIERGQDSLTSMENWTAWAMDSGLRLPYEFINLNRGIVIVNKLLQDSGSKMSLTSILREQAIANPVHMYKVLAVQEKLSYADLLRLGITEAQLMVRGEKTPIKPSAGSIGVRCEMVFQ